MVAASDPERLATIEQILRDMRSDVDELRSTRREDHHRLRAVEQAVLRMTEAALDSRAATAARQRSIEVRIRLLTAVIAAAALAEPFLYGIAHH